MKRKLLIGIACIVVVVAVGLVVRNEEASAHPGRKEPNGCHYCRTNCAQYGLKQDEYHCHNGDSTSTSQGGSTPVVNNPEPSTTDVAEQQRVSVESQTSLGQSEGYNFKISNPNANMPSLAGQSQAYVDAYQEAFNRAKLELTTKSTQLADENAKKDATTLDEMNLQVPSGVIETDYLKEYKDKFEQYESTYLETIIKVAKQNAELTVFNKKDFSDKNDYTLEKEKKTYVKYYKIAYKDYKKDLKELKNEVISRAEEDSEKNVKFLNKYKEFKVYDELVDLYNKTYDEAGGFNILSAIVGIAAIGGIGYFFFKKKNNKFKKDNNLA